MDRTPLRSKLGMALITVLLLVGVISLLLTSVATLSRQNTGSFLYKERILMANYAAQSGLRHAMLQLSENPNWAPSGVVVGQLPLEGRLGYEVELVNNFSGLTPIASPGGDVPSGQVWLRSQGTVEGKKLAGGFGRAQSFCVKPDVLFEDAFYERNHDLHPKNCVIDVYNSEPGGAFLPDFDPTNPATVRREASIRSDTSVDLEGSLLDGHIIVPDESTTVTTVGSTLSGEILRQPEVPLKQKFSKPEIFASSSLASSPNTGRVLPGPYSLLNVPDGGTVELEKGGLYYFQRVVLGEGSRLEIVDPGGAADDVCVVYVGIAFTLGQGAAVNPQLGADLSRPRDFQLYTSDEGNLTGNPSTNVTLGLDAEFTGVISGLGCRFKGSSNAELFGAVVCDHSSWDPGFTVHYDVSLRGQTLQGDPEWVLINQGSQR